MTTGIATALPARSVVAQKPQRWLFSARVDLTVFLGSAVLSLLALMVGARLGLLNDDAPDWVWIPAVLLVDVAHVYATGFRAYLNTAEFRRRPLLYALVPLLGWVIGVALYSNSALEFWCALAYLAVFHFVRQQYGWVALYRRRLGEQDRLGYWLDTLAIYAATCYPLIYWHTHLPRQFWWFVPQDFGLILPSGFDRLVAPLYWLIMAAYLLRSLHQWLVQRRPNPGKDIVVVSTALCWYLGIITFNSDYAFTVTNVLIHGIPYLALVFWYERAQPTDAPAGVSQRLLQRGIPVFLGLLWLCAFLEEALWDRLIWHERGWLFGAHWALESWQMWLVPLLAVPQLTHYVLDGFLWRRRENPTLFQAK